MSIYFVLLVSIKYPFRPCRCSRGSRSDKIVWNKDQEVTHNRHSNQDDREYMCHYRDIFTQIHKAFQLQKNHSKKYPGSNTDACKVDESPNLY